MRRVGRVPARMGRVPKRMDGSRLDSYLSRSGVDSRRTCSENVRQGLCSVNGRVIRDPSHRLFEGDSVSYMGQGVTIPPPFVAMLNKPVGYETTMAERNERRTVLELMAGMPRGCRPCGRLDVKTGGLLLVTNDGDLLHRLSHPRWGVKREYRVGLRKKPDRKVIEAMSRGMRIGRGEVCRPVSVERTGAREITLVLDRGRYHEVRRLVSAAKMRLSFLERTAYGPVRLSGVRRGNWKKLEGGVLRALYDEVDLTPP